MSTYVVLEGKHNLKLIGLLCLSAAICCADGLTTYTDEGDWKQATASSTSYFTENFWGNQINTPGLSWSQCSWDCMYPGGPNEITGDRFYASDGKFAKGLNGGWFSYVAATFTLPANIDGILLDIDAPMSANAAPMSIDFRMTNGQTYYWQLGPETEAASPAYDGVLAWTASGQNIESFTILGGTDFWVNRIAGADPAPSTATATPEPATFAVLGLGLFGIGLARKWRTSRSDE